MFKPVLIGGQDISSMRAHFDQTDRNLVIASNRQVIYYNIESGKQVGSANISQSKFDTGETIVACEKVDLYLYVFTNRGKIFVWSLENKDWLNELSLPIDIELETLVSCKMLSKRQYIFTTKNNNSDELKIFFSMSRSERERAKQRELIEGISYGTQTSFDIGSIISDNDLGKANKTSKDKLSKQRVLSFIQDQYIYFQRVGIGEKLQLNLSRQIIADYKFVCIRANPRRPMVAAGDERGRIYLYTGDTQSDRPWTNRVKLHWHSKSVNDLCFSASGNTLFSCGGESGCVVVWDLSGNHLGQKRVLAHLGMPIRHINCSENVQYLALSFEDNEVQFMDTDEFRVPLRTLTRRTYDMYSNNEAKAIRFDTDIKNYKPAKSVGLLWHSKTDTLVTNGKTGCLQFYSPKTQTVVEILNGLQTDILTLENNGRVLPSEITRAAFSNDGDWLAFYETRDSEDGLFPEVRLHIYQRNNHSTSTSQPAWQWIQTADRLHSTADIADLKFSPDGQYLVSIGSDGLFHVLYKVNLDAKSTSKQMYAKGFFGRVPESLPAQVAFSQDSSVLAIGLKNETTLIWMIVDPFKLEYECQLSRDDSENLMSANGLENNDIAGGMRSLDVLGLHFGHYEPPRSIAPLCEVRPKYIRIWNILNAQSSSEEMMEYLVTDAPSPDTDGDPEDEFTAAAFDQSAGHDRVLDHFAVSTKRDLVYIFELKINQESRRLQYLIVIDASLTHCNLRRSRYFTGMCFVANPVLEIDEKSHQDQLLLKLINRLCLMTNQQEIVSFTDKLTLERQSAINSCNEMKSYEMSELNEYFAKNVSLYRDETLDLPGKDKIDPATMTRKQRKIKQKLEVQKMLNDIFHRIPSHNLPRIEFLGPMILDKLTIN